MGINNLNAFLNRINQGNCPEHLTLDLGYNRLGNDGAQHLATALASGKCPEHLTLDLEENDLGKDGAKHLATALASGKCPKHLTLHLEGNRLGKDGAKHLAKALTSGNCPEHLTLNLQHNDLGKEGAQHLAKALTSGNCRKHLTLNLGGKQLDKDGAKHLATALTSGNCPEHLTLDLGHSDLGKEGAKHLATALASGNCPEHLTLDLWGNNLGKEGAQHLATALASGNCPEHFTLSLHRNDLGEEGAQQLATALASGNCPEYLTLYLRGNDLGNDGAKHLATALASGNCPEHLTLDLRWNDLGNDGAQQLATALTSGNCPEHLTLDLEYNDLGKDGAQHLATALASGNCPSGLTMRLDANHFNMNQLLKIIHAMQNQALKGCCVQLDNLPANLHSVVFNATINGVLGSNTIKTKMNLAKLAGDLFESMLKPINQYIQGLPSDAAQDSSEPTEKISDEDFGEYFEKLTTTCQTLMSAFPDNNVDIQAPISCILGQMENLLSGLNEGSNPEFTTNDYYEQLNTFALPVMKTWRTNLGKTQAQQTHFAEACHRLAMCYVTTAEAATLATTKTAPAQSTVNCPQAQHALAIRTKLLKLSEQYVEHSKTDATQAYQVTMGNLTRSLAGDATLVSATSWSDTQKASHYLPAYELMQQVWAEPDSIMKAAETMSKQVSNLSNNSLFAKTAKRSHGQNVGLTDTQQVDTSDNTPKRRKMSF